MSPSRTQTINRLQLLAGGAGADAAIELAVEVAAVPRATLVRVKARAVRRAATAADRTLDL